MTGPKAATNLAFPALPYETATSYGSRLVRFARAGDPFDLCLDLGLDWKSVIRGDPDALECLARRGGTSAEDLKRWSIRAVGRLRFAIGRDIVFNKTLLRSRLRVCPNCIQEDIAEGGVGRAHRRQHWNLLAIRTCHRHSRPLLQLPSLPHTFGNYDVVARVEHARAEIERTAGDGEGRTFSPYEGYLLRRLRGRKTDAYLDSLPLGVLVRFTKAPGLTRIGYRGALANTDDVLLHEAGSAGFEVLRAGPEAFVAELERLQRDPLQSNASQKQDLGPLHTWLSAIGDGEGTTAIRDTVREHIFRNYPIEAGTVVLGKPCPRTHVYSINSAKRRFRISRGRLNLKLVEAGLAAPNGNPECVTVLRRLRAEGIEPLMTLPQGMLNRSEAMERLGCSDAIFRQFRLAGVIGRRVEPIDRRPRYAEAEIDAFLDALWVAIPARGLLTSADGRRALVKICKTIGTPVLEVARLIRSGRIPSAIIDPRRKGLAAIHVDRNEVWDAVAADFVDAVPKAQAAAVLGGSLRMIDYLLSTGELALVKRGTSPRGHAMPAVTQASIDVFLGRYTTVGRLGKALGLLAQRLRFELPKLGVEPRPVPKATGLIYRRRGIREAILGSELDLPGPPNWTAM
jgi:hypothetical protein